MWSSSAAVCSPCIVFSETGSDGEVTLSRAKSSAVAAVGDEMGKTKGLLEEDLSLTLPTEPWPKLRVLGGDRLWW